MYTVLLAEDDEDFRHVLAKFFGLKGVQVVEAMDGAEAADAAERLLPDIIIMDLSMPHVDGIMAAKRLRSGDGTRDIPIIFLTAYGDYGIRLFSKIDTLRGGPIEYLTKPVELTQLEEICEKYLP